MIRKPKFMNMEKVEMTQEEFDAIVEVGDIIKTEEGEKFRCVDKKDGVPQFERV